MKVNIDLIIEDKEYDIIPVIISPAKDAFNANDINIIKEAIINANCNLYSRHKSFVVIDDVNLYYNYVLIKLYKHKNNQNRIQQSLKGIAAFIRKNYPDFSYKHSQGCRLFYYTFSMPEGEQIDESEC